MSLYILYSNTEQPSVDLEVIIKIILLNSLFNIRSVRQTIKEIETNLAYRWFLGLRMDEKVPDHSTISQAYRRRFDGTDVFRQIFDDIIRQAEAHHLVSGRILLTDSTHIRANASKKKFDKTEVDAKVNFIVDVYVTPGNVHDSTVYLERLDYMLHHFAFPLEAVALDSGYFSTEIGKSLVNRGIYSVISRRRFGGKKGKFRKSRFNYLVEEDAYRCPAHQLLRYRTTNRQGYRQYASDPKVCQDCPLLEKCIENDTNRRTITRHLDEAFLEAVNANRLTASDQYLYRLRPQTVERSFADAKELHGLRFTFYRGREAVQHANLVAATAQNMKKLATLLARRDQIHTFFSILCRAEHLKLIQPKKEEPIRFSRIGS
ncbi:transposase [Exiguobacterium profundum]